MGGWVGEWMDGSVMMQIGHRVLGLPSLIKFFQRVIKTLAYENNQCEISLVQIEDLGVHASIYSLQ